MEYRLVIEHEGEPKLHPDMVTSGSIEGAKAAALNVLKAYPGATVISIFRDGVLVGEIDTQL